MITGHITILKGLAYVLAQLVGSVFGSLLIVRNFCMKATAVIQHTLLYACPHVLHCDCPCDWPPEHAMSCTFLGRRSHWLHCSCSAGRFVSSKLFETILAPLAQAGLVPGSSIGMGNGGTGCFYPGAGINNGVPDAADPHVQTKAT